MSKVKLNLMECVGNLKDSDQHTGRTKIHDKVNPKFYESYNQVKRQNDFYLNLYHQYKINKNYETSNTSQLQKNKIKTITFTKTKQKILNSNVSFKKISHPRVPLQTITNNFLNKNI